MIQQNKLRDPAVHQLSIQFARKYTDIISPLLRQEKVGECLMEFYLAAREFHDKPPPQPEV